MLPVGNMEMEIFNATFITMGAIYLHARTFFTLADTTSIPMGALYLHARTFWTPAHMISISVGTMYLHARMSWTLAHMTSIAVEAMYLHARTLYTCGCNVFTCKNVWTLTHTTSIPVGSIYLHARTFCTLSDRILNSLHEPIFTVITEVWPCANRAVVTNNLTMIIKVVLIDVVLIECFLYNICIYNKPRILIIEVGFDSYWEFLSFSWIEETQQGTFLCSANHDITATNHKRACSIKCQILKCTS